MRLKLEESKFKEDMNFVDSFQKRAGRIKKCFIFVIAIFGIIFFKDIAMLLVKREFLAGIIGKINALIMVSSLAFLIFICVAAILSVRIKNKTAEIKAKTYLMGKTSRYEKNV